MKHALRTTLAFVVAISSLQAADGKAKEAKEEQKGAGPVNWLWRHIPVPKFGGKEKGAPQWKDLQIVLEVKPANPSLTEVKRLEVAIRLTNQGRKLVQLDFPTSQRIEVLVKNAAGKVILKWSEDQPVSDEPTLVTLNPGERLEYVAAIATRDMVPDQRYMIDGFFPRYEQLRASQSITPRK